MPNSSSGPDDTPIVAVITVTQVAPSGVHAIINDRPYRLDDLRTLFRVAVHLLDAKGTTP